MTPLTESVCEKIAVLFPPETREAAQKLIAEKCGANLPLSNKMGPDPSGFDCIRFAVFPYLSLQSLAFSLRNRAL